MLKTTNIPTFIIIVIVFVIISFCYLYQLILTKLSFEIVQMLFTLLSTFSDRNVPDLQTLKISEHCSVSAFTLRLLHSSHGLYIFSY